jgi:MFS family permease
VLILAAIIAIFIYGMIAAMLGTILPELSDRFHLSPSQNGTIAFAQALGLILASLAAGPLLDNEGKKLGIVLGLGLISIALFALPRSPGFRSIVLLLFLLGVGGGIMVTGANALASDVGEAHRATALNLANLFFGLGALATPFIAANLLGRNWVRLCYSIASLTVVTLVIEAVTRMPGPTGAGRFVLKDAAPVLGRPLLFLIGLFPFSLHRLRGGNVELAAAAPDRAGYSRIARAQYSFARIRARHADRPRRHLADSDPRARDYGYFGRICRDGGYDFSDAANQQPCGGLVLVFLAGSRWPRCSLPRSRSSAMPFRA